MTKAAHPDVVLIEDSLEDAELTIYALRGTCTHVEVDTFARSDEAWSYLTRTGQYEGRDAHSPQLIVLDFDIPENDARRTLREFKSHPELREIPVIVLTAERDPSVIRECYGLGANSVLCKASQVKGYFEQMQQLAKYWLEVNASAHTESDFGTHLSAPTPAVTSPFTGFRTN